MTSRRHEAATTATEAAGPRGRVCFYVPYMFPLFSGGALTFTGGIEVQLSLLARGLARRDFAVDVVTCDYGQPPVVVAEGVRLLRSWRPEEGLPVLRFFHPRLTRTVSALRASRADVYVVQGAGMNAGLARDVARAIGGRFVFVVGHDDDVDRALPQVTGPRDRWWARRAILGADRIVAQTEKQRALLRRNFGRESVVIMNPVDVPAEQADVAVSRTIVWLATYKASKRPEWFTRFAERHPDLHCVMAGVIPVPPLDDGDYRAALEVARRCRNLEVRGPIAHERIGELLAHGALFTHTSPAEGFPNTFLEAWSYGLPSITSFDPDGIIARERLGECHADYEAWEEAVLRWMAAPARRREAGERARAYAAREHGSGEIHDRFAALLDRQVEERRR